MAVAKDDCVEKVATVRAKGLEVVEYILDNNKAPNNTTQIEALKVALEMYKTFAVKA